MKSNTKTIVGVGLLTAIVVVLQALAVFIRPTGLFNISLVLVPIVVGAALYGYKAGACLGLVFGIVVLITDAAVTVLAKGLLCGLAAGLIYRLLASKNRVAAVVAAAVICPCVNTGVFLLGCLAFFMPTINEWAAASGYTSAGTYMILALVGVNFLIEMAVNIVLSSAIVQIIRIGKNTVAD